MEELRRNYFTWEREPYPTELLANETRLVALLPGKWNDEVRCELFHVSGESAIERPPYQALSYAWGAPGHQAAHIQVNGCEFAVTVNLNTALRFLRNNDEPIVLWIDALSINQQSDKERSSQVAKMRDIYEAADQVIIFLGDDSSHRAGKSPRRDPGPCVRFTGHDSDEDLIRQYMRKWASSLTTKQISAPDIFCIIAILSRQISCLKFTQEIPGRHLGAIFEALRTMLTARWWDRIWVVQEAVVAERMVVRYGNASMPWKMLATVASLYHQGLLSATIASLYHQGLLSDCPDSVSSDDTKVLRLLSRVRDLDHFRQTWRAQSQKLDLLALLRQFCNRNSSDSRDKIFALLGLCDQSQTLNPNYSWDEVTVYVKYLIQIIQQKRSLSPLNGDIGRKNRRDMPSWVPDWNATFDESDRGRLALAELYDACGGVTSTVLVVGDSQNSRLPDIVGGKVWEGWDLDKAISQVEEGMVQLVESLESETQPKAYLPAYAKSSLEAYERCFQRMAGHNGKLEALFNKLISFCHPEGQRQHTRFINHSLLIVEDRNLNGCGDGSLAARGRFLGTVSRVLEPLYSCSDTEDVLIGTKQWFERWLKYMSLSVDNYDPLHLTTVFAETLLSSAKLTENGLERLEKQDNAHLVSWLWRILWRVDSDQQIHHLFKVLSLNIENINNLPDHLVAESYSAAMRLSITKRAFFIAHDGRIGLGPISMRALDEIYVLPGGKMPFILRRIPRQNNGPGQFTDSAFSLVGECYLHGCMDGQMGLPNEGGIPDYRHYFQHRPIQGYEVLAKSEPDIRWISVV
ncbi:unnamed protein product [Clonostachys solani]|uniref:Heterokaryon incompatibility domain-containing protein n=1 Tax=Clonostachys solani TaxID=160281 RepID=A0A9N9ZLY6_9HYPO|nr:unnamed protein product [Clonostachys solani]